MDESDFQKSKVMKVIGGVIKNCLKKEVKKDWTF